MGNTTCLATSGSLRRSALTLDLARIERFILYLRRGRRIGPAILGFKTLNLPTHLKQSPSQRRQIARRRIYIEYRFFKPMKSSLKQHEVIICFSHNVSPGKENAHHQVGGKSMLQMSECPRIALRLAENHNHYLKGVIMKFRI